ncbi:protein DpdG [Methylophaga pinxianii]|uniref:protein DpdG n=1 Tax=Methylophaga pinxianii TaxID=2881052 RepID=UPI001CF58F52|nr:protein DpdG [Methylophaga pinxianii]MCB2426416.1 hypothetical protein [Methylophaga pinxianii]UPH44987.1 hypothetical protein LGT42_010745 [Methylophaga pinxianii]
MTILNIASDGIYNILIVLHKVVSIHGPIHKDKLVELCKPSDVGDVTKIKQTIFRWTQLGLFIESKDGELSLKKDDKDPEQLTKKCRRILFSSSNNENFWDNEGTKAADFTRALAFILSQDIYASKFDNHADVQNLEEQLIRDTDQRILQNNTRWNGFLHWASYLGFLSEDKRRWPDPTVAVAEELPELFGKDVELPCNEFLSRLKERIPVLDGGEYRVSLESRLDSAKWQHSSNSKQLSTSLSRAIWRLSRPGGPIRLEARSDSISSLILQGASGREWANFSHVVASKGV